MFDIQKKASSIEIGRRLDGLTGVVVHAGLSANGQKVDYSAGDDSGYVLEVECATATQETANNILSSLKLRGWRYQPLEADGAIIDPAYEMGDNLTANNTQSIIFSRDTNHSPLMRSTVSAPYDEEVDHEFTYEPKSTREFVRESAYTRSRLTIAEDSITAEVVRATEAEGTLTAQLNIQANAINAKVSATGGNNSSFGWTLTATEHSWYSGSTKVMSVNSSGLDIKGRITATSGYIGTTTSGFEINASNFHNGMTSLSDTTHDGVYIGTDGIALGKGAFKVTNTGAVTCSALTVTGGSVYASAIQYGSTGGYLNGGGIAAGTVGSYNFDAATTTTLGYATGYGGATASASATGPTYFNAGQIRARASLISEGGLSVTGSSGASFGTNVTIINGNNFTVHGYATQWKSLRYVSDIIGGVAEYATIWVLGRS